jgi:hypothetical protein
MNHAASLTLAVFLDTQLIQKMFKKSLGRQAIYGALPSNAFPGV